MIQISEFLLILILGAILYQNTAHFFKNQGPVAIGQFCVYSYELALTELLGRVKNEKVICFPDDF